MREGGRRRAQGRRLLGLTVEKVAINGQDATATVKADRGKKDINQAIVLVKQGAGWRISEFQGR